MDQATFTRLILLLLLLCSINQALRPRVLQSPTSAYSPVNARAQFDCAVENAVRLEWKVRLPYGSGNPVRLADDYTKEDFRNLGIFEAKNTENGTRRYSSLVVEAREKNNLTEVQCLAIENLVTSNDRSDWAKLTVFGAPDAPTELMANSSLPLSLTLSWIAPFSMPQVLLAYRINITSTNTGITFISDLQVGTSYTFVPDSLVCDFYEISVTALNQAGESDGAVLKDIPLPTLPVIASRTVQQSAHFQSGALQYTFTFTAAEACPAHPVTHYALTLTNPVTGQTTKEDITVLDNITSISVTVNSTSVHNIEPNTTYLYSVQAHNSIGFVTYGSSVLYVPDIRLALNEHMMVVWCQYDKPMVKGCTVELTVQGSSEVLRANVLSGTQHTESTDQPAHCYQVCVYSWGENATSLLAMSAATWNASCSVPPVSEKRGSESTVWVGPVSGVVLLTLILSTVSVVFIAVVMRKRGRCSFSKRGKTAPAASKHDGEQQDQQTPSYDNHTYDFIPEISSGLQGYHLSDATYSTLSRVSASNPSTVAAAYETVVPQADSQYAQLGQHPTYHVLESSTTSKEIDAAQAAVYQDIEELDLPARNSQNPLSAISSV